MFNLIEQGIRLIWGSLLLILTFLVNIVGTPLCYLRHFFEEWSLFFNDFAVYSASSILSLLPSTPGHLKIGAMLSDYTSQNPLGFWLFSRVAENLFTILSIFLIVKVIKIIK